MSFLFFFRLPRELRDQIYRDHLLEYSIITLSPREERCAIKLEPLDAPLMARYFEVDNHSIVAILRGIPCWVHQSQLDILSVCHQTYKEAMPIFYHAIWWQFWDPLALLAFLHQIGPRCRQHVSKIAILYDDFQFHNDYKYCFTMLATCGALSHFKITLTSQSLNKSFDRTASCLIEPLRYSVRGVPNVSIPFLDWDPAYPACLNTLPRPLLLGLPWSIHMAELKHDLMRPRVQESDRWHSSGTSSEPTLQRPDGSWLLLNGPTYSIEGLRTP